MWSANRADAREHAGALLGNQHPTVVTVRGHLVRIEELERRSEREGPSDAAGENSGGEGAETKDCWPARHPLIRFAVCGASVAVPPQTTRRLEAAAAPSRAAHLTGLCGRSRAWASGHPAAGVPAGPSEASARGGGSAAPCRWGLAMVAVTSVAGPGGISLPPLPPLPPLALLAPSCPSCHPCLSPALPY